MNGQSQSRRAFIERTAAAGVALYLPLGAIDAYARKGKRVIELDRPSGGDDTKYLQKVLSKAPKGALILAGKKATYRITDTINMRTEATTLDLRGSTIAQMQREGSRMKNLDTAVEITANRCTLRNGKIDARTPFKGRNLTAGQVRIDRASGCSVRNIAVKHNGNPSAGIVVLFASNASLIDCRVVRGPIAGFGADRMTIRGCEIGPTIGGANGIAVIGYEDSPASHLTISNCVVHGHQRWGIEVSLGGGSIGDLLTRTGPEQLFAPNITGNRIQAPNSKSVNGAISCLGYRGRITNNLITDPLGYGIEVGSLENVVSGNRIIRKNRPSGRDPGYGIVIDSHDTRGRVGPSVVTGNTIELADQAILGANDPGRVTISGNTVIDALVTGIHVGVAKGGATVTENTLRFRRQPKSGIGIRHGIGWGAGATVVGNHLTYEPTSVHPVTIEQPLSGPPGLGIHDNVVD